MTAPVEVPLEILGREIRASIDKGDKAAGKAEEHYMSAGLRMVEAKRRVESERGSFRAFLEQHGIGRSRAYDILAVAEGKKTFAGIRAKGAERAAKHAEQNRIAREVSVTDGHSEPKVLPAPVEDRDTYEQMYWNLIAFIDDQTRTAYFASIEGRSVHSRPPAETELSIAEQKLSLAQAEVDRILEEVAILRARARVQTEIEDARNELAIAQRNGEFQRVGELAYTTIPKLGVQLAAFDGASVPEENFYPPVFLTKGALAS